MSEKIVPKQERFAKFHTDIDEIDLENEQLIIRGKNLTELISENDIIDTIFHTVLDKKATDIEKKLLNASMTSIHTGYQAYPPTIMFPRIAISTGAPVAQALAAGYAASGQLHLGAIKRAMETYLSLEEKVDPENIYEDSRKIVSKKIKKHEMLFGFGHPLLKKDPRVDALRKLVDDLEYKSKYITMHDGIRDEIYEQKGKYSNVDGINSSILLSLGFSPIEGEGIFLLSRTIGMIAHISEESKNPAWSAWGSLVARNIPGIKEKYNLKD